MLTVQAKKTIAVYSEGRVSTGSLMHRLKQTFNQNAYDVVTVNSAQIVAGALGENTVALLLPGVQDDSRTYRAKMTPDVCRAIRSYIEKGGLCAGLCAGAYISSARFRYENKETGKIKNIRSPLALFDGRAFGPIKQYTKGGDDSHQWANHAVARLSFNKAAGYEGEDGHACYALGPWLRLSWEAMRDPDYKVIASYADIPGTPIAIASRRIGKGKAIFCGVLPEISGLDMPRVSERFPGNNPAGSNKDIQTGLAFAKKLAAHEDGRRRTWNVLIQEITGKAAP